MGLERAMDRLLELGGVTPARRAVRAGAVPLHLLELGAGPPLLLLHGGGGGGANWYRLMKPLSREHRVLAPDLPGFGLSGDLDPTPPLGHQAARVLVDLLDALDLPRVSVLGTSFGGLAALRLAQHFPGRVHRLALMGSAGLGAALPPLVRLALLPVLRRWALPSTEPGTRWLLRRLLTSTRLEPEHEAALVAYLHASAAAHPGTMPRALRAFASVAGQRERCSADELLGVRAPTLLLWGARDRFFPAAHAHRAAACFRAARLEIVPQAGHSPNWEAPAEVIARIRPFLADNG